MHTWFDGRWVILTNDDTLTPADAAQAYKAAMLIDPMTFGFGYVVLSLGPGSPRLIFVSLCLRLH